MFCPLCESENPASSLRCRACGAKLSARESSSGHSDSPDALPIGSVLGRLYHVEGVLGQGGFGITYRCRDQMLERAVAVKEFFPANSRRAGAAVEPGRASPDEFREARAQFLLEARLLARCHHPGVVMVHTAFEENGTAYMVMELLHGQNLMQRMDSRAGVWSEEEALSPVERVGAALQYVHDQGLLHRDIKPENIILCDDGRVMLIDFGTAREYAQGQSQGHTVAVTPGYAPLEQYARQAKRGAFTDVYGLAATLYHLLTGGPPPAASDRAMGVVVRPVRELNPRAGAGVASAIEAGLRMEIARRPQSVRAFLELLRAPAAEAPALPAFSSIKAEAEAALQSEIADFLSPQRFPTPSAFEPFAPVALRPRDPDTSKPSLLQPPSASLPSQSTPTTPYPATSYKPNWTPLNSSGGIGVKDPDDWGGAALGWLGIGVFFIIFLLILSNQSSSPSNPTSYDVSSSSQSPPNYFPQSSGFNGSSTAPTTAAIETSSDISASSVQHLPVSVSARGRTNSGFSPASEVSPDGKWAAYCDSNNVVRVWDVFKHRLLHTLPQTKKYPLWKITFSPDSELLALEQKDRESQGEANRISVWNLAWNKMLGTLAVDASKGRIAVTALRSPNEVLVFQSPIVGSGTSSAPLVRSLFRWNPRTGKKSGTPFQVTEALGYLVLSPDGKEFVAGDQGNRVRWANARTGAQVASGSIRSDCVTALRFSSNGSFLAVRGLVGINLFDHEHREVGALVMRSLDRFADSYAVSNDGRSVVATGLSWASKNGTWLWNVRQRQSVQLLTSQAGNGSVGALKFSPDGKQVQGVVSSPAGASLYTWPVGGQSQDKSAPQVAAASSTEEGLDAFSPSGTIALDTYSTVAMSDTFIASSAGDSAEIHRTDGSFVTKFDMSSWTRGATEPGTRTASSEFVLSSDGQRFGVRNETGKTQVWNVEGDKKPISFSALPPGRFSDNSSNQSKNIIFSSDNRLAALVGTKEKRGFVELWDLQKTPQRLALVEQDAPVSALAFSRDGRTLLVGHRGGSSQWIDVETRKVVAQAVGDAPESVVSAIVSTDKGMLAVKKIGLTLSLVRFDGAKGFARGPNRVPTFTRELFSNKNAGNGTFSPDGRLLAVPISGQFSNSIGLWNAATGSFLRNLAVDQTGDAWLHSALLAFSPDGNRLSCFGYSSKTSQTEVLTWKQSPLRKSGF